VLCCAVLCCAVLCCAVLCCAVLCCAVLCCAVLCCAVLLAMPARDGTGVPLLTLRGTRPHSRVSASMLAATGTNVTEAVSLKDYEDMCGGRASRVVAPLLAQCSHLRWCRRAVRLAERSRLLAALRLRQQRARATAPLFDTSAYTTAFVRRVQQMLDVCDAGMRRAATTASAAASINSTRCGAPMHLF
jgi:hypothetical protein